MARTFNRQPITVNTPSSSDIKNYFATQSNWKGVVTNKNFLAVDQESFEEADNVFVDDNCILRSRPALKRDSDLASVEDIIYFDNDIVIVVRSEDIIVTFADKSELVLDRPEDFRFVQTDKGILYFTVDKIQLIDKAGTITDSEIYVPKTKLVNLDGTEEKLESKNVFTDAEITVYLYLSSERNFNNESKLLGKKVTIEYGDNQRKTFTFTDKFYQIVFKSFLSLPKKSILDYQVGIAEITHKYSPIAISSAETFAFIDIESGGVYYSADGVIFNQVCVISKNYLYGENDLSVNLIRFAKNNPALLYIVVKNNTSSADTQNGIGVISVESDLPDGSLRYPSFTILSYAFRNIFDILFLDDEDYYIVKYDSNSDGLEYPVIYQNEQFPIVSFDLLNFYGTQITGMNLVDNELIYTFGNNLEFWINIGSLSYSHYPLQIYTDRLNFVSIGDNRYAGYDSRNVYIIDRYNSLILYQYFDDRFILGVSNNLVYYKKDDEYGVLDVNTLEEFENNSLLLIDDFSDSNVNHILDTHSKYLYWVADGKLISNNINEIIELEHHNEGQLNIIVPSHISELTNLFISKDNALYISQITENEAIYFPEINKQIFASKITNLQPLSESEMGIFLSDEIHYCYLTEYGYAYRKSRLDLGCKDGNDIETSFDGKYTLFDTDRGFVALSYQDFVASTEQSAVFVSDVIQSIYEDFRKQGVKLTKYKNYLLLYNNQSLLLYDLRNSSWWPWSISQINKIVRHNDDIKFIVNNKLCNLDYGVDNYYDDIDSRRLVLWSLKSQKMHLNANNNYKHIINMTFSAIGETETNPLSVKLDVINYRHFVDDGKEENFDYKVQLIRTFVKRLNYAKVREFQYILSTDNENVIQSPLQLSAITIKYKIGGQVR